MEIRLRGPGICVRPFAEPDLEQFVQAARESADSVGVWMPWCHEAYPLSEAQHWFAACAENLRKEQSYDLGIFSSDSNILYGGISINQINRRHSFGVIGYWVRTSRQRRGIATRAVQLISRFGFDTLGLTRLEIVIAAANHASQGVARNAGAVYEGIARNRLVIRAQPIDAAMYSLVPQR